MGFWAITNFGCSRRWAMFALVVAVLAALPQKLFGQRLSQFSLPVPVDIDGQSMRSTMYLKAEMKIINQGFDQFAAGGTDKAGAMFVQAVHAVQKNDVKAFSDVWSAPDEMKSASQTNSVKLADDTPGGWMKLIRGIFNFDRLTVVAEVLTGPDTMFIWDGQTKDGTLRRVFYVGPDKSGRTRLSAPGDDQPIQILLLNAFDAGRTEPDSFKPLPNINLRYQYPIPLAGPVRSEAHPVFLEFDGAPIDFPITDEKVKPPTPLLAFVRSATLSQINGKKDYPADFTPKSREKVIQWLAATENQKQEKLKQEKQLTPPAQPAQPTSTPQTGMPADTKPGTAARPAPPLAHVKFVLNADPIYLVFQAPGQGSAWRAKDLSYSYVLRQGSDYKITNFAFGNTLDEFLQDPSLFDKNVLKPVAAKPGAPNAKGVPAPAKPEAVKKN